MTVQVLQFKRDKFIGFGFCLLIFLWSTLSYASIQDNKFTPSQIDRPELIVGLPEYALIPYSYQHQTTVLQHLYLSINAIVLTCLRFYFNCTFRQEYRKHDSNDESLQQYSYIIVYLYKSTENIT